jgi:hypothetical protein
VRQMHIFSQARQTSSQVIVVIIDPSTAFSFAWLLPLGQCSIKKAARIQSAFSDAALGRA